MAPPRHRPVTYLEKNGYFPDGPFRRDTPREVFLAAALAKRLHKLIGKESIRYIAKRADLSPQTVHNILKGTTWPDLRTIARLEIIFPYQLWGSEHRKNRPYYKRFYSDR